MAGGCKLFLASIPLGIAVLVCLYPVISDKFDSLFGYTGRSYDGVPLHILDLFRTYDIGGDDQLDPFEFFDFITQVNPI